MPENHSRHRSSHAHKHGHSKRDERREPNVTWELFWSCCQCQMHAALSTVLTVACPGCQHFQCENCAMDAVKCIDGRPISSFSTSRTTRRSSPQTRPAVFEGGPLDIPAYISTAFAALPLPSSPRTGSSFRSSYSSGLFSLRESIDSSATEVESQDAESGDSESEDGEGNDVAQMLDVRLISVLSSDLDLAARLIPKLHALLDGEDENNVQSVTNSTDQDYTSHQGGAASKGKERATGGSSSSDQNDSSGSSSRKHGRNSGGLNRQKEDNNSNKRSRKDNGTGSGGNSTQPPGRSQAAPRDESASNQVNSASAHQRDMTSVPPEDDPVSIGLSDFSGDYSCPFQKRDHIKYGPWNKKYASCLSSPRKQLRRIKRHFETVHKPAQCNRCYVVFETHTELSNHYQMTIACTKGSPDLKEGIDEGQWHAINQVLSQQGHRRVNDVSRWYQIWQILFPGVEQPSNPWKEQPANFEERPVLNIDETLSKLKTLVDRDISKGLLPKDDQIHERYQYLLREIWEDDIASRGHTLSQHSGTKDDGECDAASLGQPHTSNTEQMLPTGQNNFPPLFGNFDTGQSNLGSNSFHGHFPEELQRLDLLSTFEPASPSMNTAMIDVFNSIQRQIHSRNQDSASSHPGPQSSIGNNSFTEGFLNTFLQHDFRTGRPGLIEVSGLPQPEAGTSQMATTGANVISNTSMIPATIEIPNSIQTSTYPGNQESANGRPNGQSSNSDSAFAENMLDAFWGCDFDAEASHTSGRSDLRLPEAQTDRIAATEGSSLSQEFTFDHNQGEDQLVSFLDAENEMTEARAPWKDSNSGNVFLRRRN